MKVVSPYRPCAPESPSHRKLGAFDWTEALRLLAMSVSRSNACETIVLTDYDTLLPMPAVHFETQRARLMPWIVEVSLAYLESAHFDEDTVFVSPDTLVVGPLRPYFCGDLTLLMRSAQKYHNRPIINSIQWWPVASKDRLIAFYRAALAVADGLPEPLATWGADSECLRRLLQPLRPGLQPRAGLRVSMVEAGTVLQSISARTIECVARGRTVQAPAVPIVDFKGPERKQAMAGYAAAIGVR